MLNYLHLLTWETIKNENLKKNGAYVKWIALETINTNFENKSDKKMCVKEAFKCVGKNI